MPRTIAHRSNGQDVEVVTGAVDWNERAVIVSIPGYNAWVKVTRHAGRNRIFRQDRARPIDSNIPSTLRLSASVYRAVIFVANLVLTGQVGTDDNRLYQDLRFGPPQKEEQLCGPKIP